MHEELTMDLTGRHEAVRFGEAGWWRMGLIWLALVITAAAGPLPEPGPALVVEQAEEHRVAEGEKQTALRGELLRRESELAELQAKGYGEKHPRTVALRKHIEVLRKKVRELPGPEQGEAEEAAAKTEVRRLEGELDALLASGRGHQHPRVLAIKKRLAQLQTARARLRAIKDRKAP